METLKIINTSVLVFIKRKHPTGMLTETPLERDPPPDRDPLEGTWDQGQKPPDGACDRATTQEVTSYRDPSLHGQSD